MATVEEMEEQRRLLGGTRMTAKLTTTGDLVEVVSWEGSVVHVRPLDGTGRPEPVHLDYVELGWPDRFPLRKGHATVLSEPPKEPLDEPCYITSEDLQKSLDAMVSWLLEQRGGDPGWQPVGSRTEVDGLLVRVLANLIGAFSKDIPDATLHRLLVEVSGQLHIANCSLKRLGGERVD